MLRFLGVIFFVLIIVGISLHMKGQTWVALAFYIGCGAILIGIIVKMIRRYWW